MDDFTIGGFFDGVIDFGRRANDLYQEVVGEKRPNQPALGNPDTHFQPQQPVDTQNQNIPSGNNMQTYLLWGIAALLVLVLLVVLIKALA